MLCVPYLILSTSSRTAPTSARGSSSVQGDTAAESAGTAHTAKTVNENCSTAQIELDEAQHSIQFNPHFTSQLKSAVLQPGSELP